MARKNKTIVYRQILKRLPEGSRFLLYTVYLKKGVNTVVWQLRFLYFGTEKILRLSFNDNLINVYAKLHS
jgi:hypothetical protein